MQFGPRTNICPTKVARHNHYVFRLFQKQKVDGLVKHGGIGGAEQVFDFGIRQPFFHLSDTLSKGWQFMCQHLEHRRQVAHKQTRVPKEFSTFNEHLGKLQVGLLGKGLHERIFTVGNIVLLDVTISRVRRRRSDTYGQEVVVRCHIFQTA